MIWGLIAAAAAGLVCGYALRLYGETFWQERCHAIYLNRCDQELGHTGPHGCGIGPFRDWWRNNTERP